MGAIAARAKGQAAEVAVAQVTGQAAEAVVAQVTGQAAEAAVGLARVPNRVVKARVATVAAAKRRSQSPENVRSINDSDLSQFI